MALAARIEMGKQYEKWTDRKPDAARKLASCWARQGGCVGSLWQADTDGWTDEAGRWVPHGYRQYKDINLQKETK